jgi:hypothetical protein
MNTSKQLLIATMTAALIGMTQGVYANDPVATDPVVTDPVVTDPVITDPIATDPIVTDPVVTAPVVTDPVVTDPVATDPVVVDSGKGKVDICHNGHMINIAQAAVAAHLAHGDTEGACPVVVVDPVVTDPVTTDPIVTDPVVVDPVVTDPIVVDPIATDPVVADPVVTDPVVADPVVTTDPVVADEPIVVAEPIVTEPVVDEPVAIAEPVVAEPVVTEPVVTDDAGDVDEGKKVDICHNGQTINIAKPAVAAHLAHGDVEGACPVVVAEEPVITEELPDDRIVPEDMPPADEIEADVPAEPTHEEVIAQLLVEAEGLTEGTLKDGFLTLPEVQMSLFGMTFSYAVVLEEIIAEDGSTTLVVAGIKEVEAREGVASATYSLEDGQATIPVVNVAVVDEAGTTTVPYYNVVLTMISADPIEYAIESFSETPAEDVVEETADEAEVVVESVVAEEEVVAEEVAVVDEVVVSEEATATQE